jgi:hypothetical protein
MVSALAQWRAQKPDVQQLRPYHLVQWVQRHSHGRKGEKLQLRLC